MVDLADVALPHALPVDPAVFDATVGEIRKDLRALSSERYTPLMSWVAQMSPDQLPQAVLTLRHLEVRVPLDDWEGPLSLALVGAVQELLDRDTESVWTDEQMVALLDLDLYDAQRNADYYAEFRGEVKVAGAYFHGRYEALCRLAARSGLSDGVRERMRHTRAAMLTFDIGKDDREMARKLGLLSGEIVDDPSLGPLDSPWAQAMRDTADERADRVGADVAEAVLRLARSARGKRPSATFAKAATALVDAHGAAGVGVLVGDMLSAAAAIPGNARRGAAPADVGDTLRGLAWLAGVAGGDAAVRGLGAIGVAGWRKVTGTGPFCRKAADAAIETLADLPGGAGAAQLGRIRVMVKQPTATAAVESAMDRVAAALGVSRDALDELTVPDFGLADGAREDQIGDYRARLSFNERLQPQLTFSKGDRALKSVPAALRSTHKAEVADLRAELKDLQAIASAQKLRLERVLMLDRRWAYGDWNARYWGHGLLAPIARKLIWTIDGTAALLLGDTWVTSDGQPLPQQPAPQTPVGLWHPVQAAAHEVATWRRLLEDRRIRQPFKQAHREVYLLTDAERETGIYSNRFAGHIVKQHQLAALARDRAWTYALQGAWDTSDEVTELDLPVVGLSARLFVDRPWDAAADIEALTVDSGVFRWVVTDQVRFLRHAEPEGEVRDDDSIDWERGADAGAWLADGRRPTARLTEVPTRVLSEVMRDVDLFVGVASIGNDPAWTDRGEARQFDDYWHTYAFGDLGEQGKGRHDVLSRLLPKLGIADRCELDDRFLRVSGDRRTYKIHLGSTNILMEPNDAYLCIVSPGSGADDVFLPFEGDRSLAIILSKAFLLADDSRITDETVLSQLRL